MIELRSPDFMVRTLHKRESGIRSVLVDGRCDPSEILEDWGSPEEESGIHASWLGMETRTRKKTVLKRILEEWIKGALSS